MTGLLDGLRWILFTLACRLGVALEHDTAEEDTWTA